ncbi:hypothetical protein OG800_50485 (plasmid) [Streptomyces sp. NBC_00445]|uniref:hypothetical protein n=1 Tax=Streptomyces sp. NBC_00445 TaxID=2975745 RepID=UPI002E251F67
MIGLRQLVKIPDLGLGECADGIPDREVRSVRLLSDTDWIGEDIAKALIVSDVGFLGDSDRLCSTLATRGAAGVVVTGHFSDDALRPIRATAAHYRLPLLTSSRTLHQWKATLASWVYEMSVNALERHAARLGSLFDQLRAPTPDMVQSIAELLNKELAAEVVVVGARGEILAAAPASAPIALASVLTNPLRVVGAEGRQLTTPAGLFARREPLGHRDQFLAVALKDPYGHGEKAFIRNAAIALTLVLSPSGRAGEPDFRQALTEIRLSVFQLLMTGHVTDAQRVMAGVSPGLLDSEEARVFIINCGAAPRDMVFAEVEKTLGEAMLPVRCPAYPEHIINVVPVRPEYDPEKAIGGLITAFEGAQVSVGGSSPYSLVNVGGAYTEALEALGRTEYRSDKMIVNEKKVLGLADILPADLARSWASRVLHPVLAAPGGMQILSSVAMALEFKTAKASRIIRLHRNTLHRRVTNVLTDLGFTPERVLDRIVASLAIQIVATHGADMSPDRTVTLDDVLSAAPVSVWADKFLRPLATDSRDLLGTLRAWVLAEFDTVTAAAQVQLSDRTIRWRVQEAEKLMERDLITVWPPTDEDPGEQRLSGIRPLTVALYVTTPPGGARPALTDPSPTALQGPPT